MFYVWVQQKLVLFSTFFCLLNFHFCRVCGGRGRRGSECSLVWLRCILDAREGAGLKGREMDYGNDYNGF